MTPRRKAVTRACTARLVRSRREAGLCADCGAKSGERYYCAPCRDERNAMARAYRQMRRAS